MSQPFPMMPFPGGYPFMAPAPESALMTLVGLAKEADAQQ